MALAELTASNMGFRSLQLYVVSTAVVEAVLSDKVQLVDTASDTLALLAQCLCEEAFRADICFHVLHKLIL